MVAVPAPTLEATLPLHRQQQQQQQQQGLKNDMSRARGMFSLFFCSFPFFFVIIILRLQEQDSRYVSRAPCYVFFLNFLFD